MKQYFKKQTKTVKTDNTKKTDNTEKTKTYNKKNTDNTDRKNRKKGGFSPQYWAKYNEIYHPPQRRKD